MSQEIKGQLPVEGTPTIHETLSGANIPYNPDVFNGMTPEVEHDFVDIIGMDAAVLSLYHDDWTNAKQQALASEVRTTNGLIAEVVALEPFGHMGTIYEGLAYRTRRNVPETEDQENTFKELVTSHLGATRKAIEATNHYLETQSPTELWNYFDRIIADLDDEFMRVAPVNSEAGKDIIAEKAEYMKLQEKLIF